MEATTTSETQARRWRAALKRETEISADPRARRRVAGAAMLEYALLLVVVAGVGALAMTAIGRQVAGLYTAISAALGL